MHKTIPLFALCLTLGGCIGSQVTGRDVDTSKPFPDLHSVPDKPAPADFTQIDAERADFDRDHKRKMELNRIIRGKFKVPEKSDK